MMDALLSARDRHHENWAVVQAPGEPGRLAPSFDHGNALAFSETRDNVLTLLGDEKRLNGWLDQGTSQHFEGHPPLVTVAVDALAMVGGAHREYLTRSLYDFPTRSFESAVRAFPPELLSAEQGSLVVRILEKNRGRLLDECSARDFRR